MTTSRSYTRDIKDNLNYTATWLPNLKLALGDVGVLKDYEFVYRTNLDLLGMAFEPGSTGAAAQYSHMSSGSVSRELKLAGKASLPGSVLGDADAGIVFSFSRKDAVVLLATDCAVRRIVDQDRVKDQLLTAFSDGKWDPDYVVVTELVEAGSTSIIISEGTEGRYELRASAGVVPTFEAMNVKGSFSLAHDSQIGFNFVAESGITPLFRCLGIRKTWLRTDVVTREGFTKGQGAQAEEPRETFSVEELEYEDFA